MTALLLLGLLLLLVLCSSLKLGGKGNTWSNDILGLLFNATPVANIAINATASPLTNLYVSLHTSSPGATGTQQTNEATYGLYARVAVARSGSGWTVSAESVDPVANIVFPMANSGSETETFFGIGTASSGAGVLLYFGPISPTIPVTSGVIPTLGTATVTTEA
jgi:hypothetical protein